MFKLLSLPVNKMETYEDYCFTKHEIDDPVGAEGIKVLVCACFWVNEWEI
jgi:hypothetical protein